MKTVDEPNTMAEPQNIDVWDDNMGWSDVGCNDDWDIDFESGRYSCGCCTCCGCMCWMDDSDNYEDEDYDE